ncbi:hypothetical protein V8E55_003701 [Tylopilus felleus]
MDQRFLSVFLSMESNGAAATSVPQFTWTTERDASFHDAHPSFSSGDISVTLDNDATAPMQYGISWMDSSLSGALGHIHPPHAQNTPVHTAEILPGPASVSTCKIATKIPCTQPLDGTSWSIRWHLYMHGHKHPRREIVQCPWAGCCDKLRWMNIPRHIRSVHLGARMVCPTCERSFTRSLGLTKHIASKKCSVAATVSS